MNTNHFGTIFGTINRGRSWGLGAGLAFAMLVSGSLCNGQNINVTTPLTSTSDSFYENFGINFGFSIPGGRGSGSRIVGLGPRGQFQPNLIFRQNLGVIPPFGGYNPAGGARFGFGRVGPNGGGFSLGMNFSKGSSRSIISTAPSLTVQNGFGGSIFSGGVRPFVTGVIPVVGNGPIDNGVTRALASGQLDLTYRSPEVSYVPTGPTNYSNADSSALSGDSSVKKIKAARQKRLADEKQKLQKTLDEAKALVADEEFVEARMKYRQALLQTDDQVTRRRIKAWIKAARPQ